MTHTRLLLLQMREKLGFRSLQLLKDKNAGLENTEKNLNNMSPENVLKRGYSITLLNGKPVVNTAQVVEGDTLETTVYDGKIISTVKSSGKEQ
jgi:exodeoxyribonuclease VII large subunit